MRRSVLSLALLASPFGLPAAALCQWTPQTSPVSVSLRGISAVSSTVAWASGAQGTWLRTVDGGRNWIASRVPGAEPLDFRAVQAFDANTAYLMSAGPGKLSRVYQTQDGGATWRLSLENPLEAGFFDAIRFWDSRRGILVGDPVNGRFYIAVTDDGGITWKPADPARLPLARSGEGAFAASNSCLTLGPEGRAWIATGGTGGARVYRTEDWGRTWNVSETTLRHESASSGIFSIAFRDRDSGIVVGGDYAQPSGTEANIAWTIDGGKTWSGAVRTRPHGYRSAVAFVGDRALAVGPNGTDLSTDGGRSWSPLDGTPWNALSFAGDQTGWAAGPKGTIGKFSATLTP